MEQPSALERQFVKSSEKERLHMSEVERKLLKKEKSYEVEMGKTNKDDEISEDQNLEIQVLQKKKKSISNDLKDTVQFKRKRAKVFSTMTFSLFIINLILFLILYY